MLTESAERALRFYSRIADVRLVWLDPEPPRSPVRSLPEPIKAKGTVSDLVVDQRR